MTTLQTFKIGALIMLMVAAGCAREPAPPPETYRVRAQVRQVPKPDAVRGELYVRHEAIPSFKNAAGEVVGMEAMSMSFPLADVALAAEVAAGDRIELEFDVDWSGRGNPLKVTAIEKLPEGTRLAFEAAAPEAEAAGVSEAEETEPEASAGVEDPAPGS